MTDRPKLLTPEDLRKANPGKHQVFMYGQSSVDGWACICCVWQGNVVMSHEAAVRAHDLAMLKGVHDHDLWTRNVTPLGGVCSGCLELVDPLYPEHEKLKALNGANDAVAQFLEFLGEHEYVITKFDDRGYAGYPIDEESDELDEDDEGVYVPTNYGISHWLETFFEIDPKKIDQEKRAMLEKLQADQEARDARAVASSVAHAAAQAAKATEGI